MSLWSRFLPLFLNATISDADSGSASLNGPHLGRSPWQYFNIQNRSASSSFVTFVRPSIAFSDAITDEVTDALISDLQNESIFLRARDCHLWGTFHSENNRNDSKNDTIKIRNNIYIFYNQLIFLPNGKIMIL